MVRFPPRIFVRNDFLFFRFDDNRKTKPSKHVQRGRGVPAGDGGAQA